MRVISFRIKHRLIMRLQPMIPDKGIELLIGSSVDRQFGPVILVGAGGILVEVMKDRALALPPLNSTLALRLMERTSLVMIVFSRRNWPGSGSLRRRAGAFGRSSSTRYARSVTSKARPSVSMSVRRITIWTDFPRWPRNWSGRRSTSSWQ